MSPGIQVRNKVRIGDRRALTSCFLAARLDPILTRSPHFILIGSAKQGDETSDLWYPSGAQPGLNTAAHVVYQLSAPRAEVGRFIGPRSIRRQTIAYDVTSNACPEMVANNLVCFNNITISLKLVSKTFLEINRWATLQTARRKSCQSESRKPPCKHKISWCMRKASRRAHWNLSLRQPGEDTALYASCKAIEGIV
jgi:hypothetical protein